MEQNKSTIQQDPFKSCGKCIHVKTCGAYRMFGSGLKQVNATYEFIKENPNILASNCNEYKSV